MKANELMQGDYITFKDSVETDKNPLPVKVIGIGYVGRGVENEALVEIDGDKTCDIIEINDECVGIPLTPEILEKNGFEVLGKRKYFIVPGDPSLAIERNGNIGAHGNTFTIGHFWDGKKDFRWFIEIDYVHTLQHALRLCGITLNIEV